SSLVSLVALATFLKVWQPRTAKQPAGGLVASGGGAALGGFGAGGNGFGASRQTSPYTLAQTVRAWSPFLILTAV
ncbi:L-lactate permease, partial [Escherichia coli]|nr:L-lactate permease [Escherichia coli]